MRTILVALLVAGCGGSPRPPAPPVVSNTAPAPRPEPASVPPPIEDPPVVADCPGGASYGGVTYGCVALQQGGAFASLTGTGDISSGFDDQNIYGGLLGNEAGELEGGLGVGGRADGTGWGEPKAKPRGRRSESVVPRVTVGKPSSDQQGADKAIIRRYIKRNLAKILYCYEKQLFDDGSLAGKVTVTFTIGPDGRVTASSATGVDADVASCVAQVISWIEFPRPHGGGALEVKYPFVFHPTGG